MEVGPIGENISQRCLVNAQVGVFVQMGVSLDGESEGLAWRTGGVERMFVEGGKGRTPRGAIVEPVIVLPSAWLVEAMVGGNCTVTVTPVLVATQPLLSVTVTK